MNETHKSERVFGSRSRRFLGFLLRSRPVFWKTLGCLAGVVIPVLCFGIAFSGGSPFVIGKWQSGQPNQYANLMLQSPSVLPFYPMLLFCVVCCGLVLFGGQRWINRIGVRFGIYTGVPIAIQFHLLVFAPNDWNPVYFVYSLLSLFAGVVITLFALILVMLVSLVIGKLRKRFGGRAVVFLFLGGLAIRFALVWISNRDAPLAELLIPHELIAIGIGCLVLGTTFAATAYSLLSWYVYHRADDRRLRFGLFQLFGGLTWAAGYLAAWRASIAMAIEQYKMLPDSEPGCYVCTAAARGHRKLVGSFDIQLADRKRIIVNRQLQVLKAAEIALVVTFPKLHWSLRSVYNQIGPILAACLVSRWIADCAFVLLKPVEWSAKAMLRMAGVSKEQIHELYRDDAS